MLDYFDELSDARKKNIKKHLGDIFNAKILKQDKKPGPSFTKARPVVKAEDNKK